MKKNVDYDAMKKQYALFMALKATPNEKDLEGPLSTKKEDSDDGKEERPER